MSEKTTIRSDGTKNGQVSIADKILALVLWIVIPLGFFITLLLYYFITLLLYYFITLLLVNNKQNNNIASINNDAEILLNSARILLSENNSYQLPQTIKELERKLKKSTYCKIVFSTRNFTPITILANECHQQDRLINKKYYFSTYVKGKAQELTLVLSHLPLPTIMIKQRVNVIVVVIAVIIVFGLILNWVVRLLVLKPLGKIIETTRLISQGNNDLRLSMNQSDEYGHLAYYLNNLLEQIFEQQKVLKQANVDLMNEVTEKNRIALELKASRDKLEKLLEERSTELAVFRDEALAVIKDNTPLLVPLSHKTHNPSTSSESSHPLHRDSSFTKKQSKPLPREVDKEMNQLAPSGSVKALIVDDIELNRKLLLDMLVAMNAQVSYADNGLDAIKLIQNMKPKDIPDIVFMNVHMPVMNGVEAVQRIKKTYGDAIICIAVMVSATNSLDKKYLQAGFDDFISKPYRFEPVFECLNKHGKLIQPKLTC